MASLAYPDPGAPTRLVSELTHIFAEQFYVQEVITFGSLARGDFDRWSDIDLIVVTNSRADYKPLIAELKRRKPTLYGGHFAFAEQPLGAHVLGMIFADASPFHCLDLNLLCAEEFEQPNALERFGTTQSLLTRSHSSSPLSSDNTDEPIADPVIQDEFAIETAVHFAKKSVKKYLRGKGDLDEVRNKTQHLAVTMDRLSTSPFVSPEVWHLAAIYSKLAHQLIYQGDTA